MCKIKLEWKEHFNFFKYEKRLRLVLLPAPAAIVDILFSTFALWVCPSFATSTSTSSSTSTLTLFLFCSSSLCVAGSAGAAGAAFKMKYGRHFCGWDKCDAVCLRFAFLLAYLLDFVISLANFRACLQLFGPCDSIDEIELGRNVFNVMCW